MSDNLPGNEPAAGPVPPAAPSASSVPPAPSAPVAPGVPSYAGAPVQKKGLALSALILGILSLVFSWVPIAGAVGGIIALILGIVALRKGQSKGLSLTGIITGALALIIGAIVTIGFFVALSLGLGAAQECLNGADTVEIAGQTVSCSSIDSSAY
ncbi:DUF4190 domain-containing protein [Leucobacter musarum]|uniref:DUF4190 domain-containing protein n=1 Tax=Leucobacter musarum TaxID=1930747 RepID=UPI0006A79E01|nr:DUF4190 domain-containing protein [Leucobacter musarum]